MDQLPAHALAHGLHFANQLVPVIRRYDTISRHEHLWKPLLKIPLNEIQPAHAVLAVQWSIMTCHPADLLVTKQCLVNHGVTEEQVWDRAWQVLEAQLPHTLTSGTCQV